MRMILSVTDGRSRYVEKIIEKLEELKKAELEREDLCDEEGYGDGEEIYEDGKSAGRYEQTVSIMEIVKQEAERYNNGWIPCSKELPPQPEENPIFENKPLELYLVSVKCADYPIRAFWNGKFFTDGWGKLDAVAWQPLPEIYKQKEE